MNAPLRELMEEIDMTVAAIDDVSEMLLKLMDQVPGGQCLQLLHDKLAGELDKLWLLLKKPGKI